MKLHFLNHISTGLDKVSEFFNSSKNQYPGSASSRKKYINIGASIEEISALEADTGLRFPTVYKEFLFLMGKSNYLEGDLVTVDNYWTNIDVFKSEFLDINEEYPVDLIPVEVRLDSGFYMLANEGENPAMYHFYFGDSISKNESYTLVMYLDQCLKTQMGFMELRTENLKKATKKGRLRRFLEWFYKKKSK